MTLFLELLQEMSVFLVIAYLFSKSPAFRSLTGESLRLRHKVILYLVFSACSILGTYFGLPVQDAIANTRAIGAVLAGLIGGPLLGGAVGFTAGLHRFTLGGFTAFSCGISTTAEGLLGGLVHLYLVRNSRNNDLFSPSIALVTTFCAEALQMAIILATAHPFSEAISLVQVIAAPMMLSNSVGAALFISIIRDQKNMYDKFGAIFSAQALKVAERTLGILVRGFSPSTAEQIAAIIREETGVGAVAITDREKILAFSGMAADHHPPGGPITSEITREAIRNNKVVYADGVNTPYHCTLSPDCPLGSSLVVPLRIDNEVVGTIKLYEPKHKLFLNLNRTLGEGIASLLSDQLLRARYEEQKNLLIKSELKLLQAQVNPHFLFNALNTISAIIRKDADRARELLLHLSNFFRKNLKRSGDLATLAEELDHVNSYLKIEMARFEDRLTIERDIDPQLLNLKIPTFTLQPIIENAVKHGISTMLEPGVVRLRAQRRNGQVVVEIEDNAGTYCERIKRGGLGMKIVNQRIKNLCGQEFGTQVACEPNQSTRITIVLPEGGCEAT